MLAHWAQKVGERLSNIDSAAKGTLERMANGYNIPSGPYI